MLEANIRSFFKQLCFLLLLLGPQITSGQVEFKPRVVFAHPALQEINALVNNRKYQQAIDQSLLTAAKMKRAGNWEGYIAFMLRAAEIETFEVWKAKGFPETNIEPDYRRPLAYLDTLQKYAGKYIESYPHQKANILFTKAVDYDWLNLPDAAERVHLEALAMRRELFGEDSREVADSYLWLGVLNNWGLRRKDIARLYYTKAMPLQLRYMPASRYALGSVYYGLAILAQENFEFDEAESMIKQYLSLYKDIPHEQAAAEQLRANSYWYQGDYEKALPHRMRSLKILESSGFKQDLIIQYSNLSSDLNRLKRYSESKAAIRKGQKILEASKTNDPLNTRSIFESLGELYRAMGNFDSAEYCFDKAIQVAIDAYGRRNDATAKSYINRGKLFLDKRLYPAALEDFQRALTSTIPGFETNDSHALPDMQYESPYFLTIIAAHFNKGDAFLAWHKLDKDPQHLTQALRNYQAAYHQLIIARNAMGDELSKPLLFDSFQKSIEQSISCARLLYQSTNDPRYFQDAFHFVELTKYLNVLDALHRAERAENSGVPRNLLVELRDVKNELTRLQKNILAIPESAKDSAVKLNEAEAHLIHRRRELMADISRYPDQTILSLDSMLLPVSEMQLQLAGDEQILEFFWGADSIAVFSVTNHETLIHSIPHEGKADSLFSLVNQFMNGTPSFEQEQISNYSLWTSRLYKKFFGSFIQRKKLIIIPDGPLNLISAEALVVNHKPGKSAYNTLDYLIHHAEISYAYSSSILFRNTLKGTKPINNVLAFSYSGGPGVPTIANRDQQAELPGTFEELEALSRLFTNVRGFTEQNASKSNFIRNAAGSDIIHLGVHGIGDQQTADNSRLIFRRDSLNDAELYAYEIYNLKLDAGLVVLSACESGIGHSQMGEGVFSIARAFTYAGCPSLVMSLWQVRDVFTSKIMISFYENLNQNSAVSSSLRNAKLKFLQESDAYASHPANWAAFVVNGQDLSFETETGIPNWVYLTLGILISSVIAAYAVKRFIPKHKS